MEIEDLSAKAYEVISSLPKIVVTNIKLKWNKLKPFTKLLVVKWK